MIQKIKIKKHTHTYLLAVQVRPHTLYRISLQWNEELRKKRRGTKTKSKTKSRERRVWGVFFFLGGGWFCGEVAGRSGFFFVWWDFDSIFFGILVAHLRSGAFWFYWPLARSSFHVGWLMPARWTRKLASRMDRLVATFNKQTIFCKLSMQVYKTLFWIFTPHADSGFANNIFAEVGGCKMLIHESFFFFKIFPSSPFG